MKRYRNLNQTATTFPEKNVLPFSHTVNTRYASNVVFAPPVNRQEQFLKASEALRDEVRLSQQNNPTEKKDS